MAIVIDYFMSALLRIVIVALVVPTSVITMMNVLIAVVLIVMNLRPIIVTMVHIVLLLFIGSMALLQIIMLYWLGLCRMLRMEGRVVAVLMRLELLHPAGCARVVGCMVWLVEGVSFLFGACTVEMVGVRDDVLVGVVMVVSVLSVNAVDDRLMSSGIVVLIVQRAVALVMTVRISMMVNSVVHLFVVRFSCRCWRCCRCRGCCRRRSWGGRRLNLNIDDGSCSRHCRLRLLSWLSVSRLRISCRLLLLDRPELAPVILIVVEVMIEHALVIISRVMVTCPFDLELIWVLNVAL